MRQSSAFALSFLPILPAVVSAQVNLPPGFEVVDVAVDDNATGFVDINDCGQLAFTKQMAGDARTSEVYVYDNGIISQITHNRDADVIPQINDHGQVIWDRGLGHHSTSQLIYFENGRETVVDEFKKGFNGSSLNNLGQVMWTRSQRWRRCPMKENLFFWDGAVTQQLTFDTDLSNDQPSLNDLGEYAWARAWWCEDPWIAEIHLRTGDGEQILPSPDSQNQGQKLNNVGWVVWSSGIHITLWDGDKDVGVVDWGSVPSLNDNGRVYASVWDFDGRRSWQPWVFDVSDDGITPFRLADNPYSYSRGRINAWGETAATWAVSPRNSQWSGGILFLRRIRTGDSDFDGVIDLADHAKFTEAMTGPMRVEGLCENRFLDIDYDGDLDLSDFARFQNAFTGASP